MDLLVITLPDREARKPTLTSTRVMRRPRLWRCSVTSMRSPTAPWTKSEEKRHHRNTQYHISDGETKQRSDTQPTVSSFRLLRHVMHYIPPPTYKTFNDIVEEDSHEPLLLHDVIKLHPLFCFD